jgi:hypothetical protein
MKTAGLAREFFDMLPPSIEAVFQTLSPSSPAHVLKDFVAFVPNRQDLVHFQIPVEQN